METAVFLSMVVFCVLALVDIVLHVIKFVVEYPLGKRLLMIVDMLEGDLVLGKSQRDRIIAIVREAYAEAVRSSEQAKKVAAVAATEVKQAVERVPEAAAQKVVEKLQENSGVVELPKPKSPG